MFGLKMKNKLDIVFNFDGVICNHIVSNWSHEKFGTPNTNMIKLVKDLFRNGHNIKLSTTRLYPITDGKHDHDVTTGKAKVLLKNKLKELNIFHCFSEITGYKCYGDVYIADRTINSQRNSIEEIKDLLEIARINRGLGLNSF